MKWLKEFLEPFNVPEAEEGLWVAIKVMSIGCIIIFSFIAYYHIFGW